MRIMNSFYIAQQKECLLDLDSWCLSLHREIRRYPAKVAVTIADVTYDGVINLAHYRFIESFEGAMTGYHDSLFIFSDQKPQVDQQIITNIQLVSESSEEK